MLFRSGELDWEIRELQFTGWLPAAIRNMVKAPTTTLKRGDVLFNIVRDGIDMKWLDEKIAEEAQLPAFDEVREWGVLHKGGSGVL